MQLDYPTKLAGRILAVADVISRGINNELATVYTIGPARWVQPCMACTGRCNYPHILDAVIH
jgi:hypothetical protein